MTDNPRYVKVGNVESREALWTWTVLDDNRVAVTVCEGDRPVLLLSKDDVRHMHQQQRIDSLRRPEHVHPTGSGKAS